MAPNETPHTARRRKAVRYGVPAAIAGLAAATIGLVPALAQSEDPPEITAEELITKIFESKVQTVSGDMKVKMDLGIPGLGAALGGGGDKTGPQQKLMQLLNGEHRLEVAADGQNRQKVTLEGSDGDFSVIHNGEDLWAYDSGSNEAYHAKTPEDAPDVNKDGEDFDLPDDLSDLTPQELSERVLESVDETTDVSVAGTGKVAGQDAYQLRIAPKQEESTVKDIRIAVDADNGAPLKFTLTADDGVQAVDVGFTNVNFAKPAAETFEFTPPEGAKVTEEDLEKGSPSPDGDDTGSKWKMADNVEVHGDGWTSVAEIELPEGTLPRASEEGADMLDSFTTKVDGGRVFSSRLLNVLLADNGNVYVGAVKPEALSAAAKD